MRRIRGGRISMIFQEPMTSLNPVFTIGSQITEAIRLHQKVDQPKPAARAIEMLRKVRIPAPEKRIDEYPHQFSGGMRQRAMIAMALFVQSASADRRRADHRARCHDPGPNSRFAQAAASRIRHVDPDHHARPGHRRRNGRRSGGDVRLQSRRIRPGQRTVRQSDAPLYCWTFPLSPACVEWRHWAQKRLQTIPAWSPARSISQAAANSIRVVRSTIGVAASRKNRACAKLARATLPVATMPAN